jgi:hypothetical protein
MGVNELENRTRILLWRTSVCTLEHTNMVMGERFGHFHFCVIL